MSLQLPANVPPFLPIEDLRFAVLVAHARLVHELYEHGHIRDQDKILVSGSSYNGELMSLDLLAAHQGISFDLYGCERRAESFVPGQKILTRLGFDPKRFDIRQIDVFDSHEHYAKDLPFDVILDVNNGVLRHNNRDHTLLTLYSSLLSSSGRLIVSDYALGHLDRLALTIPQTIRSRKNQINIYQNPIINN